MPFRHRYNTQFLLPMWWLIQILLHCYLCNYFCCFSIFLQIPSLPSLGMPILFWVLSKRFHISIASPSVCFFFTGLCLFFSAYWSNSFCLLTVLCCLWSMVCPECFFINVLMSTEYFLTYEYSISHLLVYITLSATLV